MTQNLWSGLVFFDLKDSTKQEQSLLKVKRELFDRDGALRPLTPNQWKEK